MPLTVVTSVALHSTDALAEKDVTLGFARLLRHELELKGFAVLMLRDADSTVRLDQRAGTANGAHRQSLCVPSRRFAGLRRAHIYRLASGGRWRARDCFMRGTRHKRRLLSMSTSIAAAITAEMQKNQIPVQRLLHRCDPLIIC